MALQRPEHIRRQTSRATLKGRDSPDVRSSDPLKDAPWLVGMLAKLSTDPEPTISLCPSRSIGLISAPEGPTLEHAMRALAVPLESPWLRSVNGQVAWSDGWGVVGADGSQRVDGATMFQAGSISKMVAAVLTLRLVDAGLFGLDDLVAEVAGEPLLVAADGSWHPQVSLRQLLAHAGGVNNGGFPGYPTDDYPRPREVIAGSDRTNTPPIRVIGLPGTAFSYSGGGYQSSCRRRDSGTAGKAVRGRSR